MRLLLSPFHFSFFFLYLFICIHKIYLYNIVGQSVQEILILCSMRRHTKSGPPCSHKKHGMGSLSIWAHIRPDKCSGPQVHHTLNVTKSLPCDLQPLASFTVIQKYVFRLFYYMLLSTWLQSPQYEFHQKITRAYSMKEIQISSTMLMHACPLVHDTSIEYEILENIFSHMKSILFSHVQIYGYT